MNDALLIGGLVLAAVLATAGVAKLLDLEGSRRAVADFGVPPRLAGPLGTLLPAAELGTAVVLAAGALSGFAPRVGGVAAGVLLAAFSVAIAVSLVRGRAPDCHCFGQLHSAPAGPRTLARNSALFVLAVFVAAGGETLPTVLAGSTALAMLAVVVVGSRIRTAASDAPPSPEGLPPGTVAPWFELPDRAGQIHTLDSLRANGQPVLLLFSDPDCGPCTALAPEVARWQRNHADELTVAVIERDPSGGGPASADEHGRRTVLLQRESEVADLYRAAGTPTAVLIGRDGAIASPVAPGGNQIRALVARSVDGFESQSPGELRVHRVLRPLRRRELLVRGAGAWAAASAVLAWPLRAAAAFVPGARRAEPCEDSFDCPEHVFMHCRGGRCVCQEGYTRCDPKEATDRKCFDLQRHRDHCGSCNHDCKGDYPECCEGECGEFGRTRCNCDGAECGGDEICVTSPDGTNTDCLSCGDLLGERRCGNQCGDPATQRCCGGKLYDKASLPPGRWECCGPASRRRLVNVSESERSCGRCNRRCARDEFCFEGRCRTKCPRGLKKCGNTCIDRTSDDPSNCGDCGVKCEGPFDTGECCNGTCCDYNAQACCPGGCKNLDHDEENCGACGNVCGPNSYCRFGVCTCPVEPCP